MYYRAIVVLQQDDRDRKGRQKIYDWLELPAAELPLEEGRRTMSRFHGVLNEARLAARRKRVEWDLPLVDQGVATLLPEIQEMRDLARLMTIDARLAIMEGDYAKASRVLENMYTMGEHLGEAGTLVSMLVGLAAQGNRQRRSGELDRAARFAECLLGADQRPQFDGPSGDEH